MNYAMRRSAIDVHWVEILKDGIVIEEVNVCIAIRDFRSGFASLEECLQWLHDEEVRLAKRVVYRLVAARQHTRSDLEKKLKQKQFSEPVMALVLTEVEKLGYLIGEEDRKEQVILAELSKGYGPRHIERKLQTRGRSDEIQIDKQAQIASIRKLLLKHKNKERLAWVRFLSRRGFDFDCISEALRELKNCDQSVYTESN